MDCGSSSKSEALIETERREILLKMAVKYLPERIREISFSMRNAIASKLDLRHPQGNDWRMVADRLGLSNDDIDKYSSQDSPTMTVLKHCEEMPCSTLIEVLERLKMFTILEVIEKERHKKGVS
jgi:hypothetical protein